MILRLFFFPKKAELNGSWLTHPALINKRIDVRVDVTIVEQRWLAGWTQRARKAHGKVGYIVIVAGDKVETTMLHVRLGATGSKVMLPASNLRPERTMYQDLAHPTSESITSAEVRVIIVGPDLQNSREHIGKYALVMPNATAADDEIAKVKFEAWFPNLEATYGLFPLFSLCRSLNIQPAGAPIEPVTRLPVTLTSVFP